MSGDQQHEVHWWQRLDICLESHDDGEWQVPIDTIDMLHMLLCLWEYSCDRPKVDKYHCPVERVVGVPEDLDRLNSWIRLSDRLSRWGEVHYAICLHAGNKDAIMLGGSILQMKEDSPDVKSWLYTSVYDFDIEYWLIQLSCELLLAFVLSVASNIQEIDSHHGPEVVDHLIDTIVKCGLLTDLDEGEDRYAVAWAVIVPSLVKLGAIGFHSTWKTFMQTCTNIHLEDDFVLVAECLKSDGTKRTSKLNLRGIVCSERDGELRWQGHQKWLNRRFVPLNMLDNIRNTNLQVAENVVLEAEVLESDTGVWAQARIDLLERIVNIDGNLEFRHVSFDDASA